MSVVGDESSFSFEAATFSKHHAHKGVRFIEAARVRARAKLSNIDFIDLVRLHPGADIGVHTHSMDNEEIYMFVSGRGRMLIDGTWKQVGPGVVVVNRAGGTHGLVNNGADIMKVIVVQIGCIGRI